MLLVISMPHGKQKNIVISERVPLKCKCGNKCRILTELSNMLLLWNLS
jgi:hypothetical protein